MHRFIQRHEQDVIGVLNGWDRIRFRGTLRWLANTGGMRSFLWAVQVLLKDFRSYVLAVTGQIRQATQELAARADRPLVYLASSSINKEERAREIAAADGVREGLICVLSCVERCWSYQVGRNRTSKRLELRGGPTKCLHYYFYFQDAEFGLLHLRLQTWFPLTVHVVLNGREWLARQMDAAGIGYRQRDNCFIDIADLPAAQRLLDQQSQVNWNQRLNRLLTQVHPTHASLFRHQPTPYYWSAEETEWASDVMFRSPATLAKLYPRLLRHGLSQFGSGDVMRFLGRKTPAHGGVNGHFQGEVVSDLKTRPEGMRIKHRLDHNSIKMYDKQGSVLRVETTINDARAMKVYRAKEGASPRGKKRWRHLRKGVADLHRRGQLSQAANTRYLNALAAVEDATALGQLAEKVCRPAHWQGRRARALNPLSPGDARLLQAVQRGEFAIHGFRNRDLRGLLYGEPPTDVKELRRQSAAVTRQLRLLRAHGLIKKLPKTHRYILTKQGITTITALIAASQADTDKLSQLAA